MYIVPNSTIRILKNVPINSDYIHTLWFSTLAEQTTYFQNKTKYTLNNNYYVNRDNVNEVQVDLSTASLVDCNYIMFRNQNHENKWVYAFIKEVRYKNEDNSVIVFEIDDMQTWLFNMQLKESFVERQHTITDAKGEWLIPENLEQGDYLFTELQGSNTTSMRTDMSLIVLTTFDSSFETTSGWFVTSHYFPSPTPPTTNEKIEGMYSGLYTFKFDKIVDYMEWINHVNDDLNLQQGIVSMYMFPSALSTGSDIEQYPYLMQPLSPKLEEQFSTVNSLDGYTPKNKKTLTSPYLKFVVTDGMGSSIEYNFEYFSNGIPSFEIQGITNSKPELMLIPLNYKGVNRNFEEAFTIQNLPMCAYSTDAYKAYLAQNSVKLGAGLIGATASLIGTAAAFSNPLTAGLGMAGAVGSISSLVSGSIGALQHASTQPPRSGGGESSGLLHVAMEQYGFRFYNVTIKREFARIIDNYFTMFGYKINRVQVPNIKARPYYTFIKTKGCTVQGELPSDSASAIRNIMDNGVTFWNIVACETANATVGDYSKLVNSVGDMP